MKVVSYSFLNFRRCGVCIDNSLTTGSYTLRSYAAKERGREPDTTLTEDINSDPAHEAFLQAAKLGKRASIMYYATRGGNLFIKDQNGKTALDLSNEAGHKDLSSLLKKKMDQALAKSDQKKSYGPVTKRELIYFDVRARGEIIRLALTYAGFPFQDEKVTNWLAMKPSFPFGQLPVLREHLADGKVIDVPESLAIMRHIARLGKLYGETESEHTRCDYIADKVNCWRDAELNRAWAYYPYFNKGDVAAKNRTSFFERHFPTFATFLSKLLAETNTGYFVCQSLTYADLIVFDLLDLVTQIQENVLIKFSSLNTFVVKIREDPKLTLYLSNRRVSDFPKKQ